ncbi:MAG: GntR family transcriptional regulator [Firmicutes bacterium]|nr:GntR family transcriptional regulator [Bacillota bacterium]
MPIPVKQQTEERLTAKALVYKTLREWITDGTLQPGEQIYDQEIAKYFNVSRTPVREAMQLLADQKLLEIEPGKQSRVAKFDYDEIEKSYVLLAELHALALQFAWDALTAEDVAEMERVNEALKNRRNSADLRKAQTLDKEFHNVIIRKAGNDFLLSFTDILNIQVLRIENLYFEEEDNYENSWRVHEKILQAIRAKNKPAACSAMRENWLRTISLVQKLKGGAPA